jgi:adenylate kinase
MSIKIILMGPPGVGKGTQASILKGHFNVPHLSTGEILRKEIALNTTVGKISKKYIDKGLFVPDEILIEIIEDYLNDPICQKGYILDGYPRNLQQVDDLNKLLNKLSQNINIAISITADKKELISRLTKRRKDSGRSDDNIRIISKRQNVYWNQTAPIIEHYKKVNLLKEINGLGSIEEVTQRIINVINL